MSDDITISKADLRQRDRKITDQQDEISRLKQQLASKGGGDGGDKPNVSASFNKDDQDTLGELAEPIQRLVTDAVSGMTSQLSPVLTQLTDSMTDLQEQVKNQNKNLFSGVASTTLKNFDKVKDTDEFKTLRERKIPGTNITYGDAWADAEERNSFSEMQEIIDMVELPDTSGEEEPGGEDPNFEPTGGSGNTDQIMGTQFKYKASDLKKKVDEYKAGDITVDQYEEFETKFNEAVDAGQVLNDLEQ